MLDLMYHYSVLGTNNLMDITKYMTRFTDINFATNYKGEVIPISFTSQKKLKENVCSFEITLSYKKAFRIEYVMINFA